MRPRARCDLLQAPNDTVTSSALSEDDANLSEQPAEELIPLDPGCECRSHQTKTPECDCVPEGGSGPIHVNEIWNQTIQCDGCHWHVIKACHYTHNRPWC